MICHKILDQFKIKLKHVTIRIACSHNSIKIKPNFGVCRNGIGRYGFYLDNIRQLSQVYNLSNFSYSNSYQFLYWQSLLVFSDKLSSLIY